MGAGKKPVDDCVAMSLASCRRSPVIRRLFLFLEMCVTVEPFLRIFVRVARFPSN